MMFSGFPKDSEMHGQVVFCKVKSTSNYQNISIVIKEDGLVCEFSSTTLQYQSIGMMRVAFQPPRLHKGFENDAQRS